MKDKVIYLIIIALVIGFIFFIVGRIDSYKIPEGISETKGRVIDIDNSEIITSNVSAIGFQLLKVRISESPYKDEIIEVNNTLNGQVEYDQIYKKGDYITIALKLENGKIKYAKAMDYYRQRWLFITALIFIIFVVLYSGFIGVKAILSFGLSLLIIWKFLLERLLMGENPILLTGLTIFMLSGIIIFLVSGFNKRGVAAFISTTIGLMITLILTHYFGDKINLKGLTQPYSQTLLISGYGYLNLKEIFYSAIILGASGAAMDISVDISASMHEIKEKNPNLPIKELIQSGCNVGKQVIGTMSTTLLLAYSGSYLTLLMLFIAKNTTTTRMLNLKVVSAEIMRTLIGSIGLVIIAPVTAMIAGVLFSYDISFKKVYLKIIKDINLIKKAKLKSFANYFTLIHFDFY